MRLAFGVAGLATLALLVRGVGAETLLSTMRPAAPWMPLVCLLEGCRILTDSISTWWNFGAAVKGLPRRILLRAHVVGYAVGMIAPAGRAAAEATKAAMLAPWTSYPTATAVATVNQAVTLYANAVISVPCALAAYALTGPSVLTFGLLGHAVFVGVLGWVVRAGTRARGVGRSMGRRFEGLAKHAEAFHDHARDVPLFPVVPIGAMVLGRAMQAIELGVIMHAVGLRAGVVRALFAQGLTMVALALGVLVPGQIGATEGAFALGASELGITAADGIVIALLAHCAQTFWVVVGALTPLLWRAPPPSAPKHERPETRTA